jgi:hypothetical protein
MSHQKRLWSISSAETSRVAHDVMTAHTPAAPQAEAAAMVAEAATQGEAAAAEEATQAEAAAAAEATQAEAVQAEGGAVASEGAGAAPPRGENKGKRKGHDERHAEAKRQCRASVPREEDCHTGRLTARPARR